MRETVPQRRGESTDARAYLRCYDANGNLIWKVSGTFDKGIEIKVPAMSIIAIAIK